ncbi:hypothetical protein N7G274_008286 [Stereocaulon virgatum]|uniref:Uncharacterized protein n=1 Tax=Stereocaulon virgatum TaxID=373712 RepID=A0ABR4A1X0_9LECA
MVALLHRLLALTRVTNDSPMVSPPRASHCFFGGLCRAQRPSDRPNHSLNPNISLLFHGSCSQCHYYHNGHEFTFSLNSEEHTRLTCQRCGSHMFGIGRTPTTFTLASVETGFPLDIGACVQELPQPPETHDSPEIVSRPHERDITDPKYDFDSISQSAPPDLRKEESTKAVNIDTGASPNAVKPGAEATALTEFGDTGSPQTRPKHALPVIPRHPRTIRGQLKDSQIPPSRKRTRSGTGITDLGLDAANDTSHTGLLSPHTSNTTIPIERTIGETPISAPSLKRPSFRFYQNPRGELVDTAVEGQVDRLARPRAQCRKQTIQRENDLSVQCKCSGECVCMKTSMTARARVESPENRSSSTSQPSQNYRGHYFSHIGHQFTSTSFYAGTSSPGAENQQRLFDPNRRSRLQGVQNTLVTRTDYAPEKDSALAPVIDAPRIPGTAFSGSNVAASNGHVNSQASPDLDVSGSDDHNEYQGYQPLVNGVDLQTNNIISDRTPTPESSEGILTQRNHDQIDGLSHQTPTLEPDGLMNALEELATHETRASLDRASQAAEENNLDLRL